MLMSEMQQQKQTALVIDTDDDSADEYVVIQQEDEADPDKNSAISETFDPVSTHCDAQRMIPTVSTLDVVADIGNGLDGDKLTVSTVSQRNAMNDSCYSQKIFNSSFFGSFVAEDQLRELVRSENEQNRQMLDNIKSTLVELATEKTNNNELTLMHKKSLEESLLKLDLSQRLGLEKDERIVALEQKMQQLSQGLDNSAAKSAQLEEELANKDEIIKVLREEIDELHRLHETRVKVWRERIDGLEQMLISQQERAEADNNPTNIKQTDDATNNKIKMRPKPNSLLFICEKCLNAFPRVIHKQNLRD